MIRSSFSRFLRKLRFVKQLLAENESLRRELQHAATASEALTREIASLEESRSSLATETSALLAGQDALIAAIRSLSDAIAVLDVEFQSLKHQSTKNRETTAALDAENKVLIARTRTLEDEVTRWKTWTLPGHFYSPFPSIEEVLLKEHEIWPKPLPYKKIPGVDMHEESQLELWREFVVYYREQPFTPQKHEHLRYYFENEHYSYSDAIFLYCMLRHLRPRRLIEVGSGFSSCVTLDTNELFLDNALSCTFIDPRPELLLSLIKEEDKLRIEIIGKKVQEVDPGLFSTLGEGDVLFIDSTHVSKALSDVNHIFFEILPRLQKGVVIHFHDVFYPFVYPKDWELERRGWNETYLLRAFLQFNSDFKVYFCNTFLEYFNDTEFKSEMPLCMKNTGGSIWIRKVK